MKTKEKVTKDSIIGELIQKHPETVEVILNQGLHCLGCAISQGETLENGCLSHGMTKTQINKLIKELNKVISK